jgi:hypothetical protein
MSGLPNLRYASCSTRNQRMAIVIKKPRVVGYVSQWITMVESNIPGLNYLGTEDMGITLINRGFIQNRYKVNLYKYQANII